MTKLLDNTKRRPCRRWICLAAALSIAAVLAIAAIWHLRPEKPAKSPLSSGDALAVPLGVEQAVVIRCAGSELVARPYRRGASVNVRIARQAQRDSVRVYDIRYVVNLPGQFELTDYLASADGTAIEGLPKFPVRGETRLTKDIETRIREIEDVKIHIWHWYDETLIGLGVLWVVWLLGLIFIGRTRRSVQVAPPPPPPSVEERIAGYLERLTGDGLSVEERAELEVLLLTYWKAAVPKGIRLAEACRQLQKHERIGPAYAALEAWLHSPAARVGAEEIRVACSPGTAVAGEAQ